jgi:hypothetical protein
MLRTISLVGVFAALAFAAPAQAVTSKEKMETCTFGANDQKLAGAARKTFMSKCMANEGGGKVAKKKPAAAAPQ